MQKLLVFLVVAALAAGNLTAQNSRFSSVNGNEKKTESLFLNKTSEIVNPVYNKEQSKFINQDGKVIRLNPDNLDKKFEKKFSNNMAITDNPALKQERPGIETLNGKTAGQNFTYKRIPDRRSPEMVNSRLPNKKEINYKPSVSVKKSVRNDVATINFKIVGNPPMDEWGINAGFHLILDSDATMCNNMWEFQSYLWGNWAALYEMCEYKIPENASPDLNNPNWLIDDIASIEIPGGIYDFAFLLTSPEDGAVFLCYFNKYALAWFSDAYADDFEFKAGYEYDFTVEQDYTVIFYPNYELELKHTIFEYASTELNVDEEIKVVIQNRGTMDFEGDIELSYRINEGEWIDMGEYGYWIWYDDGEWIEPEIFSISLEEWEHITLTFNTKAAFSEYGSYNIEFKMNCEKDLWSYNNIISEIAKRTEPLQLPLIENFDTQVDFDTKWTSINANENVFFYNENYWCYDNNGNYLRVCIPYNLFPIEETEKYLITDPINFSDAGMYNISFWATTSFYISGTPSITEKFKILYGTTSDYTKMVELENYEIENDVFNIFFKNFEIETPGIYYFAFLYYSNKFENRGELNLDNIRIEAGEFVGKPDISIRLVYSPPSACEMTDEGIIGAMVYNYGYEVTEFTLTYQVNEEEPVSQTFNKTIGLNESISVYFDQKVDFSAVGEYSIKITASTTNEENTSNNEKTLIVNHYAPLTELPFITDTSNDDHRYYWNPTEEGGWGFSIPDKCYFTFFVPLMNSTVPLVSKCIYLEPDIYRITLNISTTSDAEFYVSCGKSGTDPYEWNHIKDFSNYNTSNVTTEEVFLMEITEPGVYEIAILVENIMGGFYFYGANVEIAPNHDFKINNLVSHGVFPRMTPLYNAGGIYEYTVTIENNGLSAEENGVIEIEYNNNIIGSENFSFTENGEVKNIDVMADFNPVSSGNINLKFNVSLESGVNKTVEALKIVTDSTYAWDNVDDYFIWGVGRNGEPINFGLIYELQNGDYVTSITLAFTESPQNQENLGLAVYGVNDNLELGNKYFQVEYPRTDGNTYESITFDVPDTYLKPGKYYFELQQLTYMNVSVACDLSPEGYFYENTGGYLAPRPGQWGYIHLRPNFGLSRYTVTFDVIDDKTNIPVLDAEIEFNSEILTGYIAEDIFTGKYTYTVRLEGYEDKTGEVDVDNSDVNVTVRIISNTGIYNSNLSNIVLYPNPFKNEINISEPAVVKSVQLTNAAGQKVKSVTFDGKTISTGELTNGIYFVEIESVAGGKTVYKMVKK